MFLSILDPYLVMTWQKGITPWALPNEVIAKSLLGISPGLGVTIIKHKVNVVISLNISSNGCDAVGHKGTLPF